ncbi:MAG: hypothetical protein U1E39_14455 [Planctomycetota bacterium]
MQSLTLDEAEYVLSVVESALAAETPHRHKSAALLKGYDLALISAALKLRIAREYLRFSGTPELRSQWASGVDLYARIPMLLMGNFVRDFHVGKDVVEWAFPIMDGDTRTMPAAYGAIEHEESFARFCESLDPDSPRFWQAVYARIGLRHRDDSPQGNEGRRRPGV